MIHWFLIFTLLLQSTVPFPGPGRAPAAAGGGNSVAIGSSASASPTTGTSCTVSLTVTGTDPAVVMAVAFNGSGGDGGPSSVTWNTSENLSLIAELVWSSNNSMRLYALTAPSTGAHNLVASFTSRGYQCMGWVLTGVHQTQATAFPSGSGNVTLGTAGDTSDPVTLNVGNVTTGEALMIACASAANDPNGVTPNQSYLNSTTTINMQTGYALAATSATCDYTNTSSGVTAVAIRVVHS